MSSENIIHVDDNAVYIKQYLTFLYENNVAIVKILRISIWGENMN